MLSLKLHRFGNYIYVIMLVIFSLAPLKAVFPEDARPALVDITALQEQAVREGWTFTVGDNPAVHRTTDELCGLVIPDDWEAGAKFVTFADKADLPETFDWREVVLPPVRDQGSCGSCWAFATVGVLESNIKIVDNETVDLSEQWLLSCNLRNWSCEGGWFVHDYHLSVTDPCGDSGAVFEEDFPYAAEDLPCACPYPHWYYIDDWAYIGGSNNIPPTNAIKQAIMEYGPVSVGITSDGYMYAYTGGVYNFNNPYLPNHAVVLVGWDDNQGANGVWFMRNSWGPDWGEGGYMRIEYGCSNVGYAACYIVYTGLNPDIDEDGVLNQEDNCPWVYNPDQINTDGDKYGDSCDICPYTEENDGDYDGVCGDVDNCIVDYNPDQADGDNDSRGDVCDNCPAVYNPDQVNTDGDRYGDACDDWPNDADNDADGDNVCGSIDNCPKVYNPDQTDSNDDGVGDACTFTGIASLSPAPNAANVPVDADIIIEMKEMPPPEEGMLGTDRFSGFKVYGSQTGWHDGFLEYDLNEMFLRFDPDQNFKEGERVTAILTIDPTDSSFAWSFDIGVDTEQPGLYMEEIASEVIGCKPYYIKAADLNNDGYLDLLINNCYNCLKVGMNKGNGTFSSLKKYNYVLNTSEIILTDVDLDNDIDVLILCWYPYRLYVMKNNGDGTFAEPTSFHTVYVRNAMSPIDIDLDGDIDMITAGNNFNERGMMTLLRNDGLGEFSEEGFFIYSMPLMSIFSDDLNGDGKYDVVVGRKESDHYNLFVLMNDGSGEFLDYVAYDVPGEYISCLTGTDFDGDGDIDLAAVTYESSRLFCLFNAGDGTFPQIVPIPVDTLTAKVINADIDGDGDIDLLSSSFETDRVTVHLNDGLGDFSDKAHIHLDMLMQPMCAADFDNDGQLELVLGDENAYCYYHVFDRLYCNDADRDGLGDPADAGNVCPDDNCLLVYNPDQSDDDGDGIGEVCDNCPGLSNPGQEDADGDGYGDVCDNCKQAYNPDQADFDSNGIGDACDECTDTDGDGYGNPGFAANTCTVDNCPAMYNPDQADGDGDGVGDACSFTEIAATVPSRNELNVDVSTNIEVIFEDMPGAFAGDGLLGAGILTEVKVRGSMSGIHEGAVSYDAPSRTVTFDPDVDFVVGEAVTVTLLVNSPEESYAWQFTTRVTKPSNVDFEIESVNFITNYSMKSCVADFDNDGDYDMADVDYDLYKMFVRLNDGNGIFVDAGEYETGSSPYDIRAIDLNSDGLFDLTTANENGDNVSIFMNNGDGTFAVKVDYAVGDKPRSVYAVDLDSDGDLELVTGNNNSDNITVLYNNGDGVFDSVVNYPAMDAMWGVTGGDFNEDGHMDIAIGARGEYYVGILLNEGDGTLAGLDSLPVNMPSWTLCTVDLNGDGHLDIVSGTRYNYDFSVLYGHGDGTFEPFLEFPLNINSEEVCAADMNGDGLMDLLFGIIDNCAYLENNGDGTFDTKLFHIENGLMYSVLPVDFNGDGDLDLICGAFSSDSGRSYVALLKNTVCVDSDGDGFGDADVSENECPVDNCSEIHNPDQADYDRDGIGDVCDDICCLEPMTGNVDCSEAEEPDIADITRLIDFLYLSHDALCCHHESDCDGNGGMPDISDITALINYLYLDHKPLAKCPKK